MITTIGSVALYATMVFTNTSHSKSDFTLEITTPIATVRVGDTVKLSVILTNSAKQSLAVSDTVHPDQAELDYRFFVEKQANSSHPSQKPSVIDLGTSYVGSKVVRTLAKGERVIETTDLARITNLSAPGTYIVYVARASLGHPGSFVESNRLVLSVTR